MVCRECGAYNAEHLTHCRVCAAKLREADATGTQPEEQDASQESRPARGFVAAPSWPTRAYSGAPEQPSAFAPPVSAAEPAVNAAPPAPEPAKPAASAAYTPLGYAAAARPAPAAAKPTPVCPRCGKPALPDAPFCPYCGTPLTAAPAAPLIQPTYTQSAVPVAAPAAAPSAAPAAKPAKLSKRAAAAVDDFDDDDFDDDDDDFDDAPKKKKGKALSRKDKKKAKKSRFEDDFDDDDEDVDDLDDEDYDDDDDEDFDDDDDMPKRRGKGASFLLWGLILLLVVLIAVFGIYVVNKNFGGDAGKLFASISTAFGKDKEVEPETEADPNASAAPEATESNMYTATITESTNPETGAPAYDIAIFAPTGSSVRINTSAELDSNSVTVPANDQVILRIERDVFMPNAPCDTATVTVTPDIQVDTPTGETVQIKTPDITVTVPELTLTLDSPTTETVQQSFNNGPILISGTVDDHTVELTVNGQPLTVYDGGMFTTSYTPQRPVATAQAATTSTAVTATTDAAAATTDEAAAATDEAVPDAGAVDDAAETDADAEDAAATDADAAADAAATDTAAAAAPATTGTGSYQTDDQGREIIVIEAKKNNYVTARKVITIEPFVMQNISLVVNNAAASNPAEDQLYNAEGSITLTGTITAGSKLRASVADDADITIGEPTIDGGSFTLAVKLNTVGVHKIDLVATQEGYYETTSTVTVQRPPETTYSKYLKTCKKLSDSYADIVGGTVTTGDFHATGRITEIISSTPYTVYKLAVSDDQTVICVHRSAKSTINSGDLKEKKQVMGSLVGTYNDGTNEYPYLYVWFSLNK